MDDNLYEIIIAAMPSDWYPEFYSKVINGVEWRVWEDQILGIKLSLGYPLTYEGGILADRAVGDERLRKSVWFTIEKHKHDQEWAKACARIRPNSALETVLLLSNKHGS